MWIKENLTTIVVAMTTAAITAGGPAIARTVVDYARNAGKVDGFSAISPERNHRENRLVATDEKGHLPNNIIVRAPKAKDSKRLDGFVGPAYPRHCDLDVLKGWAYVPADAGTGNQPVQGFKTLGGGAYTPGLGACHILDPPTVSHVATGVYRLQMAPVGYDCAQGTASAPFIVSAQRVGTTPVVADYSIDCASDSNFGAPIDVHIVDLDGNPTDAPFTIAQLSQEYPIP